MRKYGLALEPELSLIYRYFACCFLSIAQAKDIFKDYGIWLKNNWAKLD